MEKEKLTHIVKAVQAGSESAITALYNSYHNDIYYYILRTLDSKNDPELAADLTQDTFIEIFQTIDKLQDPEAFTTWSRKIAYHRCTAYFRKRHDLLADEQEDGSTIFDTMVEDREEFIPGEALDKEDLKNTIRTMINSLPEEQRSAIMMRYFDELSVQEIANIQSTTEGTVKSRLNYGRKAIKKAVEDYEKKHDIKLHCAGIVPLLLWLLREQKRTNAAAQLSALGATQKSAVSAAAKAAAPKASKKAAFVVKNVAKLTARKVIAIALAGAVSAGALSVGISQLDKAKTQDQSKLVTSESVVHNKETDSSQVSETNVVPENYFGTWTNGGDILSISYSAAAERYYFEYYPSGDIPFAFFADFDSQECAFCVPEGHSCGYIETDSAGNTTTIWQETNNPALRFTCQDDLIYWYIGDSAPQTLFRADAVNAENGSPSAAGENTQAASTLHALEDYPVYEQKVGEYRSAVFGDYSEEVYPTLNTHMLNYYHNFAEEAYFFYALEDIDSNGTPELLIGKGYSADDTPEIIDIYSICGDSIVQYFENPYFGERTYLSILAGGLLENGGSSSAASGGCTIYQISADGSCVMEIADYTYYFADDNVPPPDGDYMSYEEFESATAQYQSYPNQIHWVAIDS